MKAYSGSCAWDCLYAARATRFVRQQTTPHPPPPTTHHSTNHHHTEQQRHANNSARAFARARWSVHPRPVITPASARRASGSPVSLPTHATPAPNSPRLPELCSRSSAGGHAAPRPGLRAGRGAFITASTVLICAGRRSTPGGLRTSVYAQAGPPWLHRRWQSLSGFPSPCASNGQRSTSRVPGRDFDARPRGGLTPPCPRRNWRGRGTPGRRRNGPARRSRCAPRRARRRPSWT